MMHALIDGTQAQPHPDNADARPVGQGLVCPPATGGLFS